MSMTNEITLIGNLGQDFELKETGNGRLYAKSSLATNEKYRNGQDEVVQTTEWHKIIIWGKKAKVVSEFTKKGSQLMVKGKLRYNNYEDSEGIKRTVAQVEFYEFKFLDPKSKEKALATA